eukprot:IDg23288t1
MLFHPDDIEGVTQVRALALFKLVADALSSAELENVRNDAYIAEMSRYNQARVWHCCICGCSDAIAHPTLASYVQQAFRHFPTVFSMSERFRWPSLDRRIKACLTSICAADSSLTVSCTTFMSSRFRCSRGTRE